MRMDIFFFSPNFVFNVARYVTDIIIASEEKVG